MIPSVATPNAQIAKVSSKNADFKYMTEQEKAFYSLQKYFLALKFKLEKYKLAGSNPPEYLLQKFEQTKRRLHVFSKAHQKINP
jgi:hypothetical protein